MSASPSLKRRLLLGVFCAAVLVTAAYSIFVLPYRFPPKTASDSVSYAMGFNNRVAAVACLAAVAMLSLGIVVVRGKVASVEESFRPGDAQGRSNPLGLAAFCVLCLIYLGVAVLLYLAIPALEGYGEAAYFVQRMELIHQYHLSPYRQIEFAYGPALIYLPMAVASVGRLFGMSQEMAYLVTYLALSILGLWFLYYLAGGLRGDAFCGAVVILLLGFSFLSVGLGLQYTPTRYLIPFAALLWLDRAVARRSRLVDSPASAAVAGFLLAAAVLSVSPEMGVAYLGAQTVYFLVASFRLRRGMAWGVLGGALSLPAFVAVFSPDYLVTLGSFSRGGNSFPVVPAAHIILYLATVFYSMPVLVARILDKSGRRDAKPIMTGWAILVVLMIPSALGRCDPGHVFSSGIGAILLTFALLGRFHPRAFTAYAILFLLVGVVGMRISEVYLYRYQLAPVREALSTGTLPAKGVHGPPTPLATLAEYGRLGIPLGVDRDTEYYLRKEDRLIPDYYTELTNVLDQTAIDRKVAHMAGVDTVLVDASVLKFIQIGPGEDALSPRAKLLVEQSQREWASMLFLYPVAYQHKYDRFNPYAAMARYLVAHFEPVRTDSGYVLMRRLRSRPAAQLPGGVNGAPR